VTTPAIPLIGWGAFVIAIAIFGTVQYELDLLPTLLLAGAGAGAIATGAAAGMAERRRTRRPAAPELLLRSSAATLVLTVGVTLLFVGAASVGPGVMWPGVGLMIAGAGGLLRETRAARRLRRAPATRTDA
jgi:hypothetical protein